MWPAILPGECFPSNLDGKFPLQKDMALRGLRGDAARWIRTSWASRTRWGKSWISSEYLNPYSLAVMVVGASKVGDFRGSKQLTSNWNVREMNDISFFNFQVSFAEVILGRVRDGSGWTLDARNRYVYNIYYIIYIYIYTMNPWNMFHL